MVLYWPLAEGARIRYGLVPTGLCLLRELSGLDLEGEIELKRYCLSLYSLRGRISTLLLTSFAAEKSLDVRSNSGCTSARSDGYPARDLADRKLLR